MVPYGITPTTGDGNNKVFTASVQVSGEMLFADRILMISGTDYTSAVVGGVSVYTFTTAPVLGAVMSLFGSTAISSTANLISTTGFATSKSIINRAAVQCGLSSVADPFASTDPNFILFCELLNAEGANLLSAFDWTHLIQEATITTSASSTFYAMPADFDRVGDQTEWNRSTRLPMLGPLSGPETQYIKARLTGVLFQVAYRIQGNTITFPTAPSNAQTLAFEYISNYWVWTSGSSAPNASSSAASTDIVLYEPELIIASVRLAWLRARGFDATDAERRYRSKLETTIAKNVGGRTLNMGGLGINADHLIDADNLPITGYAQ